MTIRDLHNIAAACLREGGMEEARREAGVLLSALLQLPLTSLYRQHDMEVGPVQAARIIGAARLRAQHVPLAYLTGEAEFYGLSFTVIPGVLIPRPDSEMIVEAALAWAGTAKPAGGSAAAAADGSPAALPQHLRILDLCTGTGCIGISLARSLQDLGFSVHLEMTEIDQTAICCARLNLQKHQLAESSILSATDLFPEHAGQRFDILVSNPPYIASDEITELMPEVQNHEPHRALDGGRDGLDFYRRIIGRAPDFLVSGGLMLLEHGWNQADALKDLIDANGLFNRLPLIMDYGHNPRVSGGTRKNRA